MNVPVHQVKFKKRCGHAGKRPLWHAMTVGGYNIIAADNGNGAMEVLGAGSYPGVARHMAKRYAPDIEFDGLTKAEGDDPRDFAEQIPQALAETSYLRQLQGYEE